MSCCCCCFYWLLAAIPAVYYLWRYFQGGRFTKTVRIDGKVAIITGANVGLGRENALDFARRGARVYLACRNTKAAEEVRQWIVAETGNQEVFVLKLDLSSLASVREFVVEFKKREQKLDLLINNAGVMTIPQRQLTADGFEMQFGTNHLGHFLLTNLLLDNLKASAPSRIVNLSSLAHTLGKIDRENLNSEKSYSPLAAYNQSKLANVLFTRELAKRLAGTGVTVNAVHPGTVRTELQRNHPILMVVLKPLWLFFSKSAEGGVQTQLAVALDPALEQVTGKYFSDCVVKAESKEARDDETAKWLWAQSEKMVGWEKAQ